MFHSLFCTKLQCMRNKKGCLLWKMFSISSSEYLFLFICLLYLLQMRFIMHEQFINITWLTGHQTHCKEIRQSQDLAARSHWSQYWQVAGTEWCSEASTKEQDQWAIQSHGRTSQSRPKETVQCDRRRQRAGLRLSEWEKSPLAYRFCLCLCC